MTAASAADPAVSSKAGGIRAGEAVRVFYHAEDHPGGFRLVRLLDPTAPERTRAVVGLATGWIPATVAEDWDESCATTSETRVLVQMHGVFVDAYHSEPPAKGMFWRVERRHVRPASGPPTAAACELSLLVVRWWDYWNPKNKKSRSHNVANEEMILDVVQGPHSPKALLHEAGSYEVHVAFVRTSADLQEVGERVAAAMRGRRRAGLYFLWPTQRPAQEQRVAGCVSEPELLALMRRMEAAGVPSCWPHSSSIYRPLAGKLWVAQVSQAEPELRVPLTVQVDVAAWRASPSQVAQATVAELQALQAAASRPSSSQFRGVAKLGFSWMGEDVRAFTGPVQLQQVLGQLLEGCPDDAVCLVQERVEGVACEFRLVCCRDLARGRDAVSWELVRMKQKAAKRDTLDQSFSLASHENMTAKETAAALFGGSLATVEAAEAEVRRLGERWLQWFRDSGFGLPGPAFRLDFLVARPTMGRGPPRVWTVEVCECGGSLCGLSHHARTAACLNECLFGGPGDAAAAGGLVPLPLPPFRAPDAAPSDSSPTGSPGGAAAGPLAGLRRALASGRAPARLLAALAALLTALLLGRRLRRQLL